MHWPSSISESPILTHIFYCTVLLHTSLVNYNNSYIRQVLVTDFDMRVPTVKLISVHPKICKLVLILNCVFQYTNTSGLNYRGHVEEQGFKNFHRIRDYQGCTKLVQKFKRLERRTHGERKK